jgi:hypothetical protein
MVETHLKNNYIDWLPVKKEEALLCVSENLDNLDNFKCIYESETFNSNGYEFKFLTYKNLSVKPL